jgi:MFS family permease
MMRGPMSRVPRGPLATILGAWLLASTGGWAFTVALAVYAFDRSGAVAVGAVAAARLLPAVFAAPLTGGLIDRGDRGRVVAAACAVQAACLAIEAALVLDHASLAALVVLAATISAAATAARPGLQALMPAVASSTEELIRATAAWSATDSVAFMVGGGAGGIAIAEVGAGAVVAAAAAMLALASALAFRLPPVSATETDELEEDAESFAYVLAGLRALVRTPMLHAPFALFAGMLVLEGTTDVQLVVLSVGKLGMGNGGPGVLFAVWGAGGVLGGAAVLMLVRRRGYGLALALGAICFAAGVALAGVDGVPVAVAAMAPAGIGLALVEAAVMGIVPRLADDATIGRVYALSEVLYAGAAGVGALIAPVLIDALGAAGSLAAVGIAFGVGATLALKSFARLDAGQEEAARLRELLRGVSFLAPLVLPRLERLVRGAQAVAIPAGATVIRAGEPGEEFFVVEDGTVEIVEYGRKQGPGTGFGEIALLRDVPRTATVRALTDVRLWALSRRSFIAAVTGQGDASHLAEAVVSEQLARARVSEPGA